MFVREVCLRIEDDPELGLARDDRFQQMHGVEPEASVDQGRLGPGVGRAPARPGHARDDGLDAVERDGARHPPVAAEHEAAVSLPDGQDLPFTTIDGDPSSASRTRLDSIPSAARPGHELAVEWYNA